MKILSFKPGHDGHIAFISNGHLDFSYEAEKDTGLRYSALDISMAIEILCKTPTMPDVIAISGWAPGHEKSNVAIGAGYRGLHVPPAQKIQMLGVPVNFFTSSHERSHLLCSYALSPFPQHQPCYALIWEGYIGAFYHINSNLRITKLAEIMINPGIRYAFAYALADPTFSLPPNQIRFSDAGKLMALGAFDQEKLPATKEENEIINKIFKAPLSKPYLSKDEFRHFNIHNAGIESFQAKRLARLVSEFIYNHFYETIQPLVSSKIPLLIGGGCGLNCDWNSQWKNSGLFSDVFIPPCTNDTGSAIGTAADAQYYLTGNAKLHWSVYCGQHFIDDEELNSHSEISTFKRINGGLSDIAKFLSQGAVLGWVCGRSEIGPRALGNRSILAAPFSKKMLQRLNSIKNREQFRPIAPVCLAEDVFTHFQLEGHSPWMLQFSQVKNKKLEAVTHVDGSARPQTVSYEENFLLHNLLTEFKK